MYQMTHDGQTSRKAVRAAQRNGAFWFLRTNSGRWYAYHGEQRIFGNGPKRATLNECRRYVAAVVAAVTVCVAD